MSKNVGLAAARNVVAFRRRFLGLALLIGLGLAICLSVLAVSNAAHNNTQRGGQQAAGLRAIALNSYNDRAELKRLTAPNLAEVQKLTGVGSVEPSLQVTFGIKAEGVAGALLYGHIAHASIPPPLLRQSRPVLFPLRPGEAVLPRVVQGQDLSGLYGKTIPVQYQQTTGEGTGTSLSAQITVVGLSDPSWQVDGPDSAYISDHDAVAWASARESVSTTQFVDARGYDNALVITKNSADVDSILKQLQALNFAATSTQQQLQALPAVLRLLDNGAKVLLILLGLIVAFSTATLVAALVRQRIHEIGILKAIGYTNGRVTALLYLELILVAAISCVGGFLLSIPGAYLIARITESTNADSGLIPAGLPAPAWRLALLSVLGLIVAAIVGGILPLIRAARLQPADALRDW